MAILTEIKNYKLVDFFKQPLELILDYVDILQHIEPVPTKNEVFHLKLKDVEFIKENILSDDDEALVEIIALVQGMEIKEMMKMEVVEFFGLFNSVKEQLITINKAEASSLVSTNTNFKWEAVNGSERLSKFGIYNTLETLSGGDILKWNQIMEIPYSDVFTKLLMNKTNNDLQEEMNQIKELKNK
jgi:hypothetical protein